MYNSAYYPSPKSIFTRQASMVDADRFPIYREVADSPVLMPELYQADKIDQVPDDYFQNQ